MYLGECPKIEDGHHFHGNQPQEFFFSILFHTDHNKYTMKWLVWKMSKIVSRPAPPPPPPPPPLKSIVIPYLFCFYMTSPNLRYFRGSLNFYNSLMTDGKWLWLILMEGFPVLDQLGLGSALIGKGPLNCYVVQCGVSTIQKNLRSH